MNLDKREFNCLINKRFIKQSSTSYSGIVANKKDELEKKAILEVNDSD
ncbi:MAG: hypothetical protein ACR5KW_03805 [Wolbachia sp.]